MMRTGIGIAVAVFLLGTSVLAQEPAASNASAPASGLQPPASAEAPPPAEDCHGPLYYKLKEQDRQQREKEEAHETVKDFVTLVSPGLFEARRREMDQMLAKLEVERTQCLAGRPRPSVYCDALARRDLSACDGLPTPEKRDPCKEVIHLFRAAAARDAALCEPIEAEAVRTVCGFAVKGKFDCAAVPEGPAAEVCKVMAVALSAPALPPGVPAEVADPVRWVRAIVKQDGRLCEEISEPMEAEACAALFAGDPSRCKLHRAEDERTPEDFACRTIIATYSEHPTAWGNRVYVAVGSPFRGRGKCEVMLELTDGGQGRTMKLGEVAIEGAGFWKEYHVETGRSRLVRVSAPCTWDAKSVEEPLGEAR